MYKIVAICDRCGLEDEARMIHSSYEFNKLAGVHHPYIPDGWRRVDSSMEKTGKILCLACKKAYEVMKKKVHIQVDKTWEAWWRGKW